MKLTINNDTCTSCGLCVSECPKDAVSRDEAAGTYSIFQPLCIKCSHCGMICPVNAVETDSGPFPEWKDPGLSPETAEAFIRGRRSVREYSEKQIPREIIEKLLYTGSLTSTASNRQEWKAVVLTGDEVKKLSARVTEYYAGLLKMARNPLFRGILKLTEARRYVADPYSLTWFENKIESTGKGVDLLFYHAPAVVILTAGRKEKAMGNTDCVLAGSAMMYAAQAYGLGSCMIGFAEKALNLKSSLKSEFSIPQDEVVHLVFTLGYHDRQYRRLPVRNPMPVTFLS